jgi:hypothetical protein
VLARACHSLTRVVLDSRQLIFLDVSNCGALAGLSLEALAPAVQALQVSEQMLKRRLSAVCIRELVKTFR